MIVYRDATRVVSVRSELAHCFRRWQTQAARAVPQHEAMVQILIAFGMLESALLDAEAPLADAPSRAGSALRRIALSTAGLLQAAWEQRAPREARRDETGVRRAFAELAQLPLPTTVTLRVPEGYAYYGLYPECYLAAAADFSERYPRGRAVCIGLRSIGTGLSALVATALQERGWSVRRDTVRPRGVPSERVLCTTGELRRVWSRWSDARFLIVDEGPGLSGSSFCGTAEALIRLGIPERHIAFFPSWDPPADRLNSASARWRWPRHPRFTRSFEDIWLQPGHLESAPLEDISAGAWRRVVFSQTRDYPAVQPHHERRKYLVRQRAPPRLLKFAGLGAFGTTRLRRACELAEAGFSPETFGCRNGFLESRFVIGRPQTGASADLLETMARYLAYLRECHVRDVRVPFEANCLMLNENLGRVSEHAYEGLLRWRKRLEAAPVVAIDGRMLPHEWIGTAAGFLKTDATDHHDDHFFPGQQDIAWDVAGTIAEFRLGGRLRLEWIARVAALCRDPALPVRLPFYEAAYLAYRVGYAELAARSLGDSPDGRRFTALLRRYHRQALTAVQRLEGSAS